MALRQHRVPPHPSAGLEHPQLQPGALPLRGPGIPAGEADNAVREPEVPELPPLGRGVAKTGELPPDPASQKEVVSGRDFLTRAANGAEWRAMAAQEQEESS